MSAHRVFSTDRIPSLSRIPKELEREERFCERCGAQTEHILYLVPKKVVLVYVRDHPENLHATCIVCARSTILGGEERERILSSTPPPATRMRATRLGRRSLGFRSS